MTNHPLGEDIFAAYASGALSAPMRLLMDAQSELDPTVGEFMRDVDAVGGALLDEAELAPMKADALQTALAAIDKIDAERPASMRSEIILDDELAGMPGAVKRRIREAGGRWAFAGPGVKTMELMRDGEAKAELIRIEPGRGVPTHTHEGREFTLVLCGAFNDDRGHFGRGDMCQAGPEVTHKPVAEEGEVCIALAVTDGPLSFTGPFGWVQRALRMN